MGLRLSTALALVLSLGVLAACGDDEPDVEIEEEPVEEGALEVEEAPEVAEAEVAEDDADVIAEAGSDEAVELDATVESDGEPITAEVGTVEETAEDAGEAVADAGAAVEDAGAEVAETAEVVVEETTEEAQDEAAIAASETVEPDAEAEVAETEVAEAEAAGEAEELITLDTNVTTVEPTDEPTEQDVTQAVTGDLDATGENSLDAEAEVAAAAPDSAQVEETNDVATDGIDSQSEAAMLDFDNLVLDEEGVQRLTTYVENSQDITDTQKITIVAGIDAARDNPERLAELLEQVRELTTQ